MDIKGVVIEELVQIAESELPDVFEAASRYGHEIYLNGNYWHGKPPERMWPSRRWRLHITDGLDIIMSCDSATFDPPITNSSKYDLELASIVLMRTSAADPDYAIKIKKAIKEWKSRLAKPIR